MDIKKALEIILGMATDKGVGAEKDNAYNEEEKRAVQIVKCMIEDMSWHF